MDPGVLSVVIVILAGLLALEIISKLLLKKRSKEREEIYQKALDRVLRETKEGGYGDFLLNRSVLTVYRIGKKSRDVIFVPETMARYAMVKDKEKI